MYNYYEAEVLSVDPANGSMEVRFDNGDICTCLLEDGRSLATGNFTVTAIEAPTAGLEILLLLDLQLSRYVWGRKSELADETARRHAMKAEKKAATGRKKTGFAKATVTPASPASTAKPGTVTPIRRTDRHGIRKLEPQGGHGDSRTRRQA